MPSVSYTGVVHVKNRASTDNNTYIYLRLSSGVPATIFNVSFTSTGGGFSIDGISSLLNSNQQDHLIKFAPSYPSVGLGLIGDLLVSLKDIDDNLITNVSIPIVVLD